MKFNIRRKSSKGDTKTARISWPWKDMSVGDEVDINGDLRGRAQVSVHVYGRAVGKSFQTSTDESGVLTVVRVR